MTGGKGKSLDRREDKIVDVGCNLHFFPRLEDELDLGADDKRKDVTNEDGEFRCEIERADVQLWNKDLPTIAP